jgi:hypothetical protein
MILKKITGASHFTNDLGLDSLDVVEVVMAVEEVHIFDSFPGCPKDLGMCLLLRAGI